MSAIETLSLCLPGEQRILGGGEGGGLLRMSSDWDDRVGIKIKTQKNL